MSRSLSAPSPAAASPALPALSPVAWCLLAAVVSAAMLAAAHTFQYFGYAPCGLCLRQREVYWAALATGLVGAAISWKAPRVALPVVLSVTAIFAAGLIVAAFHAGVEWKWWPGPLSCTGAGAPSVGADAMAELLAGKKVRPPSCDEAAWRMLGISMAGYNTLISAGLVALGALAVGRARRAEG